MAHGDKNAMPQPSQQKPPSGTASVTAERAVATDIRLKGTCRALYCLDIARGIDLQVAQESLTASRRTVFHHKSRAPESAGLSPPLRMSWPAGAQQIGRLATAPEVEISLYDLGALCITWIVAIEGPPEELVELSAQLYDHADLIARSRELAQEITSTLTAALDRPALSRHIEDYNVFEVEPVQSGPAALLADSRGSLARILRAENGELSDQEIDDALANPVSYGREDVCLVDWLAAFLMGSDMEDERHVLELATVELLELRILDADLEKQIEEAYDLFARRRTRIAALAVRRHELEHVARVQADDALLHEGIDNALKVFGDDYLARLYRTAAERFHFDDYDRAIQRKLGVLRSVYQSLSELASHHRSEILEWIIIVLIAIDIIVYFTPH